MITRRSTLQTAVNEAKMSLLLRVSRLAGGLNYTLNRWFTDLNVRVVFESYGANLQRRER